MVAWGVLVAETVVSLAISARYWRRVDPSRRSSLPGAIGLGVRVPVRVALVVYPMLLAVAVTGVLAVVRGRQGGFTGQGLSPGEAERALRWIVLTAGGVYVLIQPSFFSRYHRGQTN